MGKQNRYPKVPYRDNHKEFERKRRLAKQIKLAFGIDLSELIKQEEKKLK